MFYAIILVCAVNIVSMSQSCAVFEDQWGPHNTEENCFIRTNQMADDVVTSLPSHLVVNLIEEVCAPGEGEPA